MKDTDDDGEFHLEGVEEVELVGGTEPFGVKAEGIDAALLLCGVLVDGCLTVTAAEYV